jgi:MurNAc alpha-1-phosphate uridylyltransferase
VVLAAGQGRRLRPLTALRPKPLCPVGNQALIDRSLEQVGRVTPLIAVNLHHGQALIEQHLDGRDVGRTAGQPTIHRSIERSEPLGTAGALAQLRPWIDGRNALVVNADGWSDAALTAFADGWDGERVRVLMTAPSSGWPGDGRPAFGPAVGLVASLLPWSELSRLATEPSGLYEVVWRRAHAEGRLDVVVDAGRFVDCGRPADYLRANRLALDEWCRTIGGAGAGSMIADGARIDGRIERSVIGARAVVAGTVVDSVVWPDSRVEPDERLVRAVRAGRLTVEVR